MWQARGTRSGVPTASEGVAAAGQDDYDSGNDAKTPQGRLPAVHGGVAVSRASRAPCLWPSEVPAKCFREICHPTVYALLCMAMQLTRAENGLRQRRSLGGSASSVRNRAEDPGWKECRARRGWLHSHLQMARQTQARAGRRNAVSTANCQQDRAQLLRTQSITFRLSVREHHLLTAASI